MNSIRMRAREQFPSVLLTLLSIIQAIALESLWDHARHRPELYSVSWDALLGWLQICSYAKHYRFDLDGLRRTGNAVSLDTGYDRLDHAIPRRANSVHDDRSDGAGQSRKVDSGHRADRGPGDLSGSLINAPGPA